MSLIPASYIEKSWRKALASLEYGELEFIAPNGEITLAKGAHPGPKARFKIQEWDVLRRDGTGRYRAGRGIYRRQLGHR